MGKSIKTLVKDIERLILKGKTEFDESVTTLGEEVNELYTGKLLHKRDSTEGRSLRMSNLGMPCERKLWYSIHQRGDVEDYNYSTLFKFHFGDYIESVLLRLAKDAGHEVLGEQDELEIDGIKGHRDCVIDGVTVDVKSASTNSFKKFKLGLKSEEDSFGYLDQLKAYIRSGKDDPLVKDKTTGAFLVVDKQHGHITLDIHEFTQEEIDGVVDTVEHKKSIVNNTDTVPDRGFDPVPDGKSGNMKLGVNCSYCGFKQLCYPEMRTFMYSNGPRFLTNVARKPDVVEVE